MTDLPVIHEGAIVEGGNTADQAGVEFIPGDGMVSPEAPFWFCCWREMVAHPDHADHPTHEVRVCVVNPDHIKMAEHDDPNRPAPEPSVSQA